MMKKILCCALFLVLILFCFQVEAKSVRIDYGKSEIYSQAEMNSAITLIKGRFDKWKGCRLKNIRYVGDKCNNSENISWLNEIATAREGYSDFTQCIEFISDLYVSKEAAKYTVFDTNRKYRNYQWWLARNSKNEEWQLVSFGY